jgi:hypothetical protein
LAEERVSVSLSARLDPNAQSRVKSFTDGIKGVGAASKEAAAAADDLAASIDAAGAAADKGAAAVNREGDAAQNAARKTKGLIDVTNVMNGLLDELGVSAEGAATSLNEEAAATDRVAASTRRSAAELRQMRADNEMAAAKADAAAAAFERQGVAAHHLGSKTQGVIDKLAALGSPALYRGATAAAVGLGAIAYEGITQYQKFHTQLLQTFTQAGQPVSRFADLQKGVIDIALQTGQAFNDVADSLYRVSSATSGFNNGMGASVSQLIAYTDQVAKLQVLGNIPGGKVGEQTARVLGAVINAGMPETSSKYLEKHPMKQAKVAAAIINAAVGAGDIRMQELISALGRGVLTSAKSTGTSLKDATAFIDLLTSMGTTGSVAGTYVSHAFQLLAGSTDKTRKYEEAIGIDSGTMIKKMKNKGILGAADFLVSKMTALNAVDYLKSGKFTGQEAAIDLMTKAGMSPAMIAEWKSGALSKPENQLSRQEKNDLLAIKQLFFASIFGGGRQEMPLLTLMQNRDKYKGISTAIEKRSTMAEYDKAVKLALDNPQVQMKKQFRRIQLDLINIGEAITPTFVTILKGLANFIEKLKEFKGILILVGGALAALLTTALVSKAAEFTRHIGKMMGGAAYGV